MKPVKFLVPIAFSVALVAVAAITRRDFSRPNLVVLPDMVYSVAYETFGANPVLPHGMTQQPPVAGTVPRGYEPQHYGPSEVDRRRAAKELQNPVDPSLQALARGKQVFQDFCVHCHGPLGKGDGAVAQRIPTLSMPIHGRATQDLSDGEIFHIISHGRNNMPEHKTQIRQQDRWAVVQYLRDLQRREEERLRASGLVYEDATDPRQFYLISPEYGAELFKANCATCHGDEGRTPQRGVPTLNLSRVLAVADEDYYLDIITHGRKGTQMPAWEEILTPTQIRSLGAYIQSWAELSADRSQIGRGGVVSHGASLYRGNCIGCHGVNGEGGVGISLNSPLFQAVVSDEFLRDTILQGRKHSSMPGGTGFSTQDTRDLVAYLRHWSAEQPSWEQVSPLLADASPKVGKKLWRASCTGCHDKEGEGGIGSRLNSQSFLSIATDKFLYHAIVEGRPGTAMPSWRHLQAADLADLISYIRSWQNVTPVELSDQHRGGRAQFGEFLYASACQSCHGPEGRGGLGGQIANPIFLKSVSDDFLWRTIAYGKDDTAMRGFLEPGAAGALMPMSGADIDHIIAYLRELESRPHVEPLERVLASASVRLGNEIYHGKGGCAQCHGAQGEGASGPALGDPDFLNVASDGYLVGTIILGRDHTEMLSFYRGGNVNLTMEEVESVVAWLRSLQDLDSLPRRYVNSSESSVQQGQELYLKYCAGCHGTDGKGPASNAGFDGYAPSLNNPDFLRAADDGFLLATIAAGRVGTPMRAFGKGAGGIADLTAEEIRNIVAYLRSWEEK